jgi:hypothetical protein
VLRPIEVEREADEPIALIQPIDAHNRELERLAS